MIFCVLSKKKPYLVRLVYLFMFFTLFDGIFRKWVFPSLSALIMVIKQVIAIWIVIKASRYYYKFSIWEKSFMFVGVLVFITSLLFGHQNILVAIWGCLPYWFGLTLCCIISQVLTLKDLHNMGKVFVYFMPINTILIVIQLILPISHWLNYRGGETEDSIAGMSALTLAGLFRPSGIYMSTAGLSFYILLASSFLFYFLFVRKDIIKRKYLITAYVCCWISSICAVSRSCIFYIIGITIYCIYFMIKNSKKAVNMTVKYSIGVMILFICFFITPLGEKAVNNMADRFDNASVSNVGDQKSTLYGTVYDIYNRNIAYLLDALIDPKTIDGESVPFWGYGQGMSTQTGGKILSGGKNVKNSGFLLAEWDGLRIMCESGLIFGWIILFLRLGYVFRFLGNLNLYAQRNMFLCVFLYPIFMLTFFVMNTWGNVTNACIAYLAGGMFLAARRMEK